MQQPTFDLVGGAGELPPHPNDPRPDEHMYTSELLESFSDGDLGAHYFSMIDIDPYEREDATKALKAEARRRKLTTDHLRDAWDKWLTDQRRPN